MVFHGHVGPCRICRLNTDILLVVYIYIYDVWVAANSTILPGVKIADGCVIAAGSVVTSDCDVENSLYGGIPARFIKKLEK